VIMPDHVHFFCRPEYESKTLSQFHGRLEELVQQERA
jgi:REP element-mobilizing transposase RayT